VTHADSKLSYEDRREKTSKTGASHTAVD
jgi:hypothetical protein